MVLRGRFEALRSIWRREHLKDDTPKAIDAQWRAWQAAIKNGATPDEIEEGARPHIAAADAPRHLPKLVDFLNAEGWTRPPPEKRPQRKSSGKPQRMTPARAMAALVTELRQGE